MNQMKLEHYCLQKTWLYNYSAINFYGHNMSQTITEL